MLKSPSNNDALGVIEMLNSGVRDRSELGLIQQDIDCSASRANVSFSFVPRSCNHLAHSMAVMLLLFQIQRAVTPCSQTDYLRLLDMV